MTEYVDRTKAEIAKRLALVVNQFLQQAFSQLLPIIKRHDSSLLKYTMEQKFERRLGVFFYLLEVRLTKSVNSTRVIEHSQGDAGDKSTVN